MTANDNLAKEYEYSFLLMIENNSNIEADEDDDPMITGLDTVKTFEDAGLCTNDRGLVLNFEDGTEIHLTIQAYSER